MCIWCFHLKHIKITESRTSFFEPTLTRACSILRNLIRISQRVKIRTSTCPFESINPATENKSCNAASATRTKAITYLPLQSIL